MAADNLSLLMDDLRNLSATKLSAILECLTNDEQHFILSHLEGPIAEVISFSALAGLSPWLAERMGDKTGAPANRLTKAAREALVEIVAGADTAPSTKPDGATRARASLFDRVIDRRALGRRAA